MSDINKVIIDEGLLRLVKLVSQLVSIKEHFENGWTPGGLDLEALGETIDRLSRGIADKCKEFNLSVEGLETVILEIGQKS